ncbi:LysR family transcriptional regulator [Neptunicella sp. SCSIO 80796]|uniref:LysR family transcriptional regulator n=1 Tax=Neptunicella plasticusilytica TaxID=3117012 RepID=UPI003A4E1A5D
MINDLRAIGIFAETVKRGSFKAAADYLKLSPSVVSYHISQLEKSVGTALLYRSTRKLSLTHEGKVLLRHAELMLEAADQGINEISAVKQKISGQVSISLPNALIRHPLMDQLAKLCQQQQDLTLSLLFSDNRQNLVAEGIDLALRAGKMPDSGLKSRKIGEIKRKLVCSKTFYHTYQQPESIDEIAHCQWIKLDALPSSRVLLDPEGQRHQLNFSSQISVNNVEAMYQLCIKGLGFATPPDYLIESDLQNGSVIEVLPEWQVEPIPLYAVWPPNVSATSNSRRVLDHLLRAC